MKSGSWMAGAGGAFVVGDVFRISRENGYIKFYKNGSLLFTTTQQLNDELVLDVGMKLIASEISNIQASFATGGSGGTTGGGTGGSTGGGTPQVAEQPVMDRSPGPSKQMPSMMQLTSTLTSTATVWNAFSGAHSNQTLAAGTDGWAEFTISALGKHIGIGFSKATAADVQYAFDYYFEFKNNNQAVLTKSGSWMAGAAARLSWEMYFASAGRMDILNSDRSGSLLFTTTQQLNDELVLDVGMKLIASEISDFQASFATGDSGGTSGGGTGEPVDLGPTGPVPISDLQLVPQYNGNIAAISWKGANDQEQNIYAYHYDGANRIKAANYSRGSRSGLGWNETQVGGFSVHNISYDLNGNIETLNRQWLADDMETMDALTYSYDGNRLMAVSDAARYAGFYDGNTTGNDYIYDDNGNMTQDLNKDIVSVEYNHLNLPSKVTKSNGDYIEYIYDASGIKIQQIVHEDGNMKTTDYSGEYIYEDGQIALIQHEEGRLVTGMNGWEYQYHLKDHLGNVRTTFTTAPKTITFNINFEQLGDDDMEFAQVDTQTISTNDIFDHTDANGTVYQKAQRLDGTEGRRIGTVLAVPVEREIRLMPRYLPST